jgi:hypothetical protein
MSIQDRLASHQIPLDEWAGFCDRFSRQHRGGRVTLEAAAPEGNSRPVATEMPLQGIVLDRAGGRAEMTITVGEASGPQLTHTIAAPARVMFLETETGAQVGMDIEAADGQTARLRFRVPVRLEMMDGWVK